MGFWVGLPPRGPRQALWTNRDWSVELVPQPPRVYGHVSGVRRAGSLCGCWGHAIEPRSRRTRSRRCGRGGCGRAAGAAAAEGAAGGVGGLADLGGMAGLGEAASVGGLSVPANWGWAATAPAGMLGSAPLGMLAPAAAGADVGAGLGFPFMFPGLGGLGRGPP